ncbi:LOW QUALITY PROTEIN: tRNA N(3)-methylcytidine methyltransferase METTL6-like [Pollicipes pollicipes]|uniref:LOW QUALITY PROTEIN: tRNA N(3)-methylcytidine methyltransferase METTL6-like n=1 Tax=Pollicipes pollicipes TaxID=41117 RepID=UPI001884B4FE|nr:LOW QUALITY PROTEIN: tRNA N(3)-methylcytidine methyltransferase METTL6-like [Pollicipes pollicipes]
MEGDAGSGVAADAAVTSGPDWNSLSDDSKHKLQMQESRGLVGQFKQLKLEQEAAKNWDKFYKRNETRFYKDRHWTTREFEDLADCSCNGQTKILFEVGCGVGNFLYPLLQDGQSWFIHACDFSPRAIDFVKSHSLYDESRVHPFVHDITSRNLHEHIQESSVDIVSLIFVLSSIMPEKYDGVIQSLFGCLKEGGSVIFRDYGRYDMAQIRFGAGHKLAENFYVRQDGTRVYYFTTSELTSLFSKAGFEVTFCTYVARQTVNKKEGVDVSRTFVQGKFKKPSMTSLHITRDVSNTQMTSDT